MDKEHSLAAVLVFVLVGVSIALIIQPSKADASIIYIRTDGSIEPSNKPISTSDKITYNLTGNISDSIAVQRSNIVVEGGGYTLQGSGIGDGFNLTNVSNVTIRNVNVQGFHYGIDLKSASFNVICGDNMTGNTGFGVKLRAYSNNNTISGNYIGNNGDYGIWLSWSSYNSIDGNVVTGNWNGIYLDWSGGNMIRQNDAMGNSDGIRLDNGSNNNTLSGNNVTGNDRGMTFSLSSFNIVYDNSIAENDYGIWLLTSSNNTLYHNSFNNTRQIYVSSSANTWDDGYPSGGNYWSDYHGDDNKSGPNQDQPDSDMIGDTPYVIDASNRDRYPKVPEFTSSTFMLLLIIGTLLVLAMRMKRPHE